MRLTKSCLQMKLAVASFVVAVAFSIAGFLTPPTGDLTDANLYLIAQFLLVTTSILGVTAVMRDNRKYEKTNESNTKDYGEYNNEGCA